MRVAAGPAEGFDPGMVRVVAAGDRRVAVFNVDGELIAIDDRCAHQGQSLAEGVVRNGIVTCPAHLWRYDLRTGRRHDAPGFGVDRHPLWIENGELMIDVPDPEPPRSMRELLLEHAREWRRDQ